MAELRVTSTGTIKLFESDDTSSVTIASPASLGGDRTITLPDANVDLTEVNTMPIANLDIDGGTDIGAAITDSDLFIIDDGAGGTNRKTAASRIKTYVGGFDVTSITGATELAETPADTDEFIISDAGTLKRVDFSHIKSTNEPAWEVGLSSNQSINNSTHTRLAMTVLRANTSSTYWDSTNYKTQNLTAGKYYAWFNLTAESDIGASTIYLQIRHFNSSDSQQAAATLAAADFHRENGAAVVGLFNIASGDYLDYTFWQNSGSATDQIYEANDGSTCRGGGFKIA